MKANDLMAKAERAVASARLLVDAGDVDGACNRAYYAMFDAAKAALTWSEAAVDPVATRTHSGLISTFSLYLVKTGIFPVEMGKALNRAAEIRLVADYSGDEVSAEKARWLVDQADSFVRAISQKFS